MREEADPCIPVQASKPPSDLWLEAARSIDEKDRKMLNLQDVTESDGETNPVLDEISKTEKLCDEFKSGQEVDSAAVGIKTAAEMMVKYVFKLKSLGDAAAKFDKSGYGK